MNTDGHLTVRFSNPRSRPALPERERFALMLIFQGDGRGTDVQHAAFENFLVQASQFAADQSRRVLRAKQDRLKFKLVKASFRRGGRREWRRDWHRSRWRVGGQPGRDVG